MADLGPIVVNGRFLAAPITGVQRYARELVVRLPKHVDAAVEVVAPGGRTFRIHDGDDLPEQGELTTVAGPRAHAWEQTVLPVAARRRRARLVLNLCNAGPVMLRNSVLAIHDISPLAHPEFFSPAFSTYARRVWPLLVRRARLVVTPSGRSRDGVVDHLGVPEDRIVVVPPAVGDVFVPDGRRTGRRYCLVVGGHDDRKNIGFLTDLWPDIRRQLGLELVVTRRTRSLPHGRGRPLDGVTPVDDPDDATLADLYRGAVCVLSASEFEGFGLPLLEGMACGTPFLSTDVGAARDLAVDRRQILPLDPEVWVERLHWVTDGDRARLGRAGVERAARYRWDHSARTLAHALIEVAA